MMVVGFLAAASAALVATSVTAMPSVTPLSSWAMGPADPFSDKSQRALAHLPAATQHAFTANGTVPVTTPCTIMGCLVDGGYVGDIDPFYGKNLQLFGKPAFAIPWTFATTFDLPDLQAPSAEVIVVVLEGVNYRAEVTVNGYVVSKADTGVVGALQRFDLDITDYVTTSGNTINVTLERMYDDPGNWRNNGTDLSLSFDDWNPHPPDLSMGLWRPAAIKRVPIVRFPTYTAAGPTGSFSCGAETDGFAAKTTLGVRERLDGSTTVEAYLNVSAVLRCWRLLFDSAPPNNTEAYVLLALDVPGGWYGSAGCAAWGCKLTTKVSVSKLTAVDGVPTLQEARAVWSWMDDSLLGALPISPTTHPLVLQNAPLWWPYRMNPVPSVPPVLHEVSVAAASAGGSTVLLGTYQVGLREIKKHLTAGGALQLVINRVPFQVQGGGFPPDMFLRVNESRLAADFDMMQAMGLNTVRLEGMLQDRTFYDLADARGFLVTPGFGCCDGWQHWPRWPKVNYAIARDSLRSQARVLGTHPSVIAFIESSDQLPPAHVEAMYNRVFEAEAWPNVLVSSASQQPSYVSGLSGVKMVGPYSWVAPGYWLEDGSGLLGNGTMNYGGAWGYLTEGGPGEAPMTYASWRRTVPEAHLWNPADGSLDSWWSWHMGCPYGNFPNLTYYTPPLNARYGTSMSAQTYLYRSQLANYEGIRAMFEGYNRNKVRNATGIIQWQVKMAWPSHLWNLFDYYYVGGGGFYGAKKALCGAGTGDGPTVATQLSLVFSYADNSVSIISNDFIDRFCPGQVATLDIVDPLTARMVWHAESAEDAIPAGSSTIIPDLRVPTVSQVEDLLPAGHTVYLVVLRLTGSATCGTVRNVYWLSTSPDVIGPWAGSNSFRTPCAKWADFSSLNALPPIGSSLAVSVKRQHSSTFEVTLNNTGLSVAFFTQVRFVDTTGCAGTTPTLLADQPDVPGIICDDNFVTLLPREVLQVACVARASFTLPSSINVDVQTYNDVVASQSRERPPFWAHPAHHRG